MREEKCSNCGAMIGPDVVVCPNCGRNRLGASDGCVIAFLGGFAAIAAIVGGCGLFTTVSIFGQPSGSAGSGIGELGLASFVGGAVVFGICMVAIARIRRKR